ncbi:hypothetical protein RYX36_002465, partial [Vicia faba]
PSIDISESFDDLLFMKRGGELIYADPLGPKSSELVIYFEAIEGVPKIRSGYNPATWMLKVTSSVEENRLGVDFVEIYRKSSLYQYNQELVEGLSIPASNSKELHFPTNIDIFESFDELLFMKRGGELIYADPLGPKSSELVSYFEAIEGVPKIRSGYNPATWMLKVTSSVEENRLGVDFVEIYRKSSLYQYNQELVEGLSIPA